MTKLEIETEIETLKKRIKELEEEKAKIDYNNLINELEENCYYKIHRECDIFYFKFTKDNIKVEDSTNTVGNDGSNWVIIKNGIKEFFTMTRSSIGIFNNKYFQMSQFSTSSFEHLKIEKITEEEFKEVVEILKNKLEKFM